MSQEETMTPVDVAAPIVALLEQLFDYAGLFPPSALDMEQAVENYHQYLESDYAWMLGRFVVPVGRLEELASASQNVKSKRPWSLSVLSSDWSVDAPLIKQFLEQQPGRFELGAVETRQLERTHANNWGAEFFVELDLTQGLGGQIKQLATGDAAKLRAGGLAAENFPTAKVVADFVALCQAHGAAFKATAGLHHALPSQRPTCADDNAPLAAMHGFVNLSVAAALCREGLVAEQVVDVLQERELATFQLASDHIHWRSHSLAASAIREARRRLIRSIGSCSFETPITELRAAGWLP